VDASVVARAERLGATQVATMDRKHFTSVRPAHVRPGGDEARGSVIRFRLALVDLADSP
jgi:hypothetical protein